MDLFSAQLNTVLAIGNDVMHLCCRLQGQCEIHAWVDGPDRAWFADQIEKARSIGVFRPEMGWEKVIDLLRSADDQPVVTYYSVTDSFPGSHMVKLEGFPAQPDHGGRAYQSLPPDEQEKADEAWAAIEEAWEALTDDQRWEASLAGLRAQGQGLQIKPADIGTFGFAGAPTFFELTEAANRLRIAQAASAAANA